MWKWIIALALGGVIGAALGAPWWAWVLIIAVLLWVTSRADRV